MNIVIVSIILIIPLLSILVKLHKLWITQKQAEGGAAIDRFLWYILGKTNRRTLLIIVLAGFCSAAIFFCAIVCVSYIPKNVHKELSGIEILMTDQGEFVIVQQVDISIDGRIHDGMFSGRPRYFRGMFDISGFDLTGESEFEFRVPSGLFRASLMYRWIDSGHLISHRLGYLFADNKLASIAIINVLNFDQNQDDESQRYRAVAAPAADIASALEVLHANGVGWSELGFARFR